MVRPDRPLTEKDTLAFRVIIHTEGYCSLYAVYREQVDRIVVDAFLTQGIHDLPAGHSLSGNKGLNTLVMLFADAPIRINEEEKQKLILESARNKVPSLTIEKSAISMSYQEIEIKQAF